MTVIAGRKLRDSLEDECIRQAVNAACAPGVTAMVLNPDAHSGFGAPIGSVIVSPSHIYPGPVGVDIKCSMSLLQLELDGKALESPRACRALIRAICSRIPLGPGRSARAVPLGANVDTRLVRRLLTEGASTGLLAELGIPAEWTLRCEDSFHRGHDGSVAALERRLDYIESCGDFPNLRDKLAQLGSYGGGNHFGEAEVVEVVDKEAAVVFGLQDGKVAFLSHCGSRGFGHDLAMRQFRLLRRNFEERGIAFPGGDPMLVYAPLGSREADDYLDDMALAGNFSTANHLLINRLVLEAFKEVFPGVEGRLIYCISHNFARLETVGGEPSWVHRKGATRAFPAGHPALEGGPFEKIGHPILLPGNPQAGSMVMRALPGAAKSCYSVNHGAGRRMGRNEARRTLDQRRVDEGLAEHGIISNCSEYPLDEAPEAYKDFEEVLASVEMAGLAARVAALRARFVVKDEEKKARRRRRRGGGKGGKKKRRG